MTDDTVNENEFDYDGFIKALKDKDIDKFSRLSDKNLGGMHGADIYDEMKLSFDKNTFIYRDLNIYANAFHGSRLYDPTTSSISFNKQLKKRDPMFNQVFKKVVCVNIDDDDDIIVLNKFVGASTHFGFTKQRYLLSDYKLMSEIKVPSGYMIINP